MTLSLFDPLSHWGSRTESFVRRRFENPSDVSSSHNGRFNTACPPLRHFRLPSFAKDCILKSQFECLNRERVSKRRISSVPDFERARLRRRAPPLPLCPLKSPERARATKVGGLDSARPNVCACDLFLQNDPEVGRGANQASRREEGPNLDALLIAVAGRF